MLLYKNARSIARVALAKQSLACPVRAQTVLLFSAKVVARRATRERDNCARSNGASSSAKIQKSRFGLAATRLDSVCS